jgi:hypothetical protein
VQNGVVLYFFVTGKFHSGKTICCPQPLFHITDQGWDFDKMFIISLATDFHRFCCSVAGGIRISNSNSQISWANIKFVGGSESMIVIVGAILLHIALHWRVSYTNAMIYDELIIQPHNQGI